MLLGNQSILMKCPVRFMGGSTTSVEPQLRSNWNQAGRNRNQQYVSQTTTANKFRSITLGYYPPYTWCLPTRQGYMSAHDNTEMGIATNAPNLYGGVTSLPTATFSIDTNTPAGELIITVQPGEAPATFGIDTNTPNLEGILRAIATIGYIDPAKMFAVTAFLGAINGAGCTISMSFTPAATLTADGNIAATITSEGEAVTPTSVAAAVWNALTAAYSMTGSMGAAMAAAGSAGDPWITNLPGAYGSGQAGNIIGNLLAASNAHTDAAVAGIDTTSLKYSIESLRPSHQGFGTAYFWDYINGSDANDGLTPTTGKATWAAVEALVESGAGDTVYVLPDPGSSQITIDQRISITKASLNLRGPGRTVKIKPSSGTGDTITIGAVNVSIKGFVIEGATGDITGSSILINDKFARIEDNWINRHGYGIRCRAGDYHFIVNNTLEYHALNGMHFDDAGFATPGSPREAYIHNNTIYFNSVDGIHFADTTGNSTRLNILLQNRVHHNGRYGIYIGDYVQRTMVQATNYIKDNGTVVVDPTTKAVSEGAAPNPANEIFVATNAGDPMVDVMPDIAATAILTAAQTTPIHSEVKKVATYTIGGSGTELDPWGPV